MSTSKADPVPVRGFTSDPRLIVIRSFDGNEPGEEVGEMKSGVTGGSILTESIVPRDGGRDTAHDRYEGQHGTEMSTDLLADNLASRRDGPTTVRVSQQADRRQLRRSTRRFVVRTGR